MLNPSEQLSKPAAKWRLPRVARDGRTSGGWWRVFRLANLLLQTGC